MFPAGNADLVNQLRRAAFSVPLNIAEGAGKVSQKDKRRFYSIARGSALECAAVFDIVREFGVEDEEVLLEAERVLVEIVCMLSKMSLDGG